MASDEEREIERLIADGLAALRRQYGDRKHHDIKYSAEDGKFLLTVDRGGYLGKRIYTAELMRELIADRAVYES